MARSAIYPSSVQPGKPRLGSPPRGWCTVTFSDLFEVIERPAVLDDSEEYQLITAKRSRGGIVPRERLRGKDILTRTQFYVSEGDFLISNRQIIHGGCGIVPPALDGAIVSNEYTVLRPRPVLRPDFLLYLPHSIYFQQTCFHASVGVDVEKMVFDVDQWSTFKIHLPPMSEQEAIAEILLGIDDAIRATQAVIEQTRKVRQGGLERLLTKGIGHSRFKQTEIGAVPEDWKVLRLEEIAAVERGKFSARPRNDPRFYGGDIPFVQTGDVVRAGGILKEHSQTLNKEGLRVSKMFPSGTVLVTIAANIGDTAITSYPICCPDSVVGVSPHDGIDCWWLREFLVTQKSNLDRQATKNAQKNINLQHLKPISVPTPPSEEQYEIGQHARHLASVIDALERELEQQATMKSALMCDLLTGRKRVSAYALSPAL